MQDQRGQKPIKTCNVAGDSSLICHTCIDNNHSHNLHVLDSGKKLENLQETHTEKLQTPKRKVPGPSCCEVTVITIEPLCCRQQYWILRKKLSLFFFNPTWRLLCFRKRQNLLSRELTKEEMKKWMVGCQSNSVCIVNQDGGGQEQRGMKNRVRKGGQ